MKELIILPGNSVQNRTWGEVMRDHYGPLFDSVYLHTYEHWETGDPIIDFDVELVKLRERTKPLFGAGVETVVLAKSAGSLIAFVAVAERILQPTKCIFFGIPFDLAATGLFKDDWSAVAAFTAPMLVFHNLYDPTTDYRFTAAILAQHLSHVKLITTNEEDHWYGNTDEYDKSILPFLGLAT